MLTTFFKVLVRDPCPHSTIKSQVRRPLPYYYSRGQAFDVMFYVHVTVSFLLFPPKEQYLLQLRREDPSNRNRASPPLFLTQQPNSFFTLSFTCWEKRDTIVVQASKHLPAFNLSKHSCRRKRHTCKQQSTTEGRCLQTTKQRDNTTLTN